MSNQPKLKPFFAVLDKVIEKVNDPKEGSRTKDFQFGVSDKYMITFTKQERVVLQQTLQHYKELTQ